MQLDIKTSLVIAAFVSLIPTLIGALIWQRGRTCPGFGRWTLGNLLATLCLICLSLRGTTPDWISIVLANALALGAAILFLQGIRLFRGLRLYWWPEHLAGMLGIAAVIYFRYATDNLNARVVAMSAVLGAFGLCCGFTLLKQVPSGRRLSMVLTGIVFILAGVANFIRMYFYTSVPASDLFAPSGPNAAFFVSAGLGVVGWSFGFLLMTDERMLHHVFSPVTYYVREPLLAVRNEPGRSTVFLTIVPGSVITLKGEVQLSGFVDVLYEGQIVLVFKRDIDLHADRIDAD
jgi:hypothetical protein